MTEVIIPLLILVFGFSVGSFLNVVIRRGIRGESLLGRSHCESCGRVLTARELVPILSFFIQRGKCLGCGGKFSIEHPLVEFATALLFAASAILFLPADLAEFTLRGAVVFILILVGISAAIVVFVVDLKEKIIPDSAFFVLFLLGISALFLRRFPDEFFVGDLRESAAFIDVFSAILFSSFFACLWFFSRGTWMGFGDAKLVLAVSLILGWSASLAAFLFSFWIGGAAGGVLLAFRRSTMKSTIPFGPFILFGSVVAYFFAGYFFETSRFLEGMYEIFYYSF